MTLSAYTCIQLALIVLWNTSHAPKTSATIASASLNLVSAVSLILLSHFEHSKTIKPSDIINIYLFASLLLDITRVRTQWLLPNREDSIASILTLSVVLKVLILGLEATEKRKYLISTYRNYSRESTSGIFNHLFFWWLNPLFLTGSGKVLSFEDLYAIDEALGSESVARSLQETWDGCILPLVYSFNLLLTNSRLEENREFSILLACKSLQATTPFLQQAINYVSSPDTQRNINTSYGLVAAYGLVYISVAAGTDWKGCDGMLPTQNI
ncbi:ABC multidrug transporter protein [Rutstroemia sp. NJR-2017a WRK4]|nr:ABC multidrug transporter protein [Rutstroemia sp. NJR-2017a WRK4]